MSDVFVLGGYQTDFARNLAREGHTLADLVRETVEGALDACHLDASHIETVHVGNAFGELFASQAQLGAMPATVVDGLWGRPAARHEAACASGGVALLAAMAELEAGRYGCALVLGVEQERNVSGELAARHLGTAAWTGHEGDGARYLWPHQFSRIADAYDERYGLSAPHLAALAQKNFANARDNPLAQTRAWTFSPEAFTANDALNPVVEGRLRRLDCGQVSDGASAIVVCTADFARRHAGRSLDRVARIRGWGHRTAGLGLDQKLRRSVGDAYVLPHMRAAIVDAYRRAGVSGPDDVDGFEVHDCFTITEYMIVDHLGITAPGEAWRAIEDRFLERGGTRPVNPSGGLIGGGHPVGATGVRMVLDAARQVTHTAGACQVDDARTFGTVNLGGSGTTVVSFIVGVDAENPS
jgi:acetyl-CoA C-acetyltransferase